MAKKQQVKLSNGEHYFTPEEVQILKSKGVDLDSLAPNANGGNGSNGYVDGGHIRKNSTGNATADRYIDEINKGDLTGKEFETRLKKINILVPNRNNPEVMDINQRFQDYSNGLKQKVNSDIQDENWKGTVGEYETNLKKQGATDDEIKDFHKLADRDTKTNYGSSKFGYDSAFKESQNNVLTRRKKELSQQYVDFIQKQTIEAKKQYDDVVKNSDKYTPEQIAESKKQFEETYKEGDKAYRFHNAGEYDYVPNNVKELLNKPDGTFYDTKKVSPLEDKLKINQTPDPAPNTDAGKGGNKTVKLGDSSTATPLPANAKTTTPKATGGLAKKVDDAATLNSGAPLETPQTNTFGEEQTRANSDDVLKANFVKNYAEGNLDQKQKALDDVAKAKNPFTDKPQPIDPGTSVKKSQEAKSQLDLGTGLAALQFGIGALGAEKQGALKPNTIPQDFLNNGEDLRRESQFGMSPEAVAAQQNNIELNRRMQTANAISQSGGDMGVTSNNERAATIDADAQNLDLAAKSDQLRYAKKLGYGNFLKDKMNASNDIYNQYLDRFNKTEMADANLIGSGVKNLIEGDRYNKALQAEKERTVVSTTPVYKGNDLTENDLITNSGASSLSGDARKAKIKEYLGGANGSAYKDKPFISNYN